MAHIGEILIAGGHLTQDGLSEALDWQVLYGGRLGTNLLELRLVEEEKLAHALGRQLGAEVAWGELTADPALISSIPPHVADRKEIIPWKLEKRRLKILCCEIKVGDFDDLSYKLGRTCVPVVAPEFRIFQLLRAHYQAQRQMRALDFGVVPEEGRRRKKEKEAAPAEAAPELIDETAFNDMYAQVLQGRGSGERPSAPAPVAAAPAPAPAPVAAYVPQGVPPGYPVQEPPAVAPPPPPAAPPPTPARVAPRAAPPPRAMPPAARPPAVAKSPQLPPSPYHMAPPAAEALEETIEALPDDAILGEMPDEVAAAAESPLKVVDWGEAELSPKPARDESPLGFKEALKALEGVSDRDSIAHLVLRASRAKAARALLLQVQGGVALGWDGLGDGLENGAARAVALPLATDSAFSLVVKTRSHYMGPLHKTPLNIRFLAMLGKRVPLSALIIPILHKGRVSHMLYLDNGHKQQAPTDVGEMLILSQRIGQTVEALIERKRKAARR